MSTPIRIPAQLRELSGGAGSVVVEADSVGAALAALELQHPGFEGRLFDDHRKLRRFLNVYVDEEDVRFLDGLDTRLAGGDTISIIPAIAGG
jgi:molybdopterin converting factor small subunit